MKTALKRLTGLAAAALVLALGLAIASCGGSEPAAPDAQEGAAIEDINIDVGQEIDEAAHMEGDEAEAGAHDGGEGHEGSEANSYLEAAAKDRLFLIKMTSFAFTPNEIEVEAGEVVEIAIQNVEPVLHDFTIEKIDADVHISFLEGTGQHAHGGTEVPADVHFALTEPGTGVVHLKIREPGAYTFYCTVPGHLEAGMVGTLTVLPQSATDAAGDDEADGDEAPGHDDDGHEH